MNKDLLLKNSKKLHNIAANYIVGNITNLSESIDPKISIYVNLVKTCKLLKESLENQDIENITKLLEEKQKLSNDFYNLTCIRWRL